MNTKKTFLLVTLVCTAISLWALPTAVKNKAFYQGISYAWPYNAAPADQTTSNLSEIATDPDQIIAMLRTVYMNKSIPGNYVRGYDANGNNEGTWVNGVATGNYPVAYPAIGVLGIDSSGKNGYVNQGWNLAGNYYMQASSGSVTFKRGTDRARAASVSSNGITFSTTSGQLFGSSGSGNDATYFLNAPSNSNLVFKAETGKKITKIQFTFISGYSAYITGCSTGSYSSPTWTGEASEVIFYHTQAIRIDKVEVTYVADPTEIKTSNVEPDPISVQFIAGTDYGNTVSISGSTGSSAVKGPFRIDYLSNMGTTGGTYLAQGGDSNYRFLARDEYYITHLEMNFLDLFQNTQIVDARNISEIGYTGVDGNSYKVTATSVPSLSDFISSDYSKLVIDVPMTYFYFKVTRNKNVRIKSVYATCKYNGLQFGFFAPDMFVPDEEGNTVLLLEVKDGVDITELIENHFATADSKGKFDYYNVTDYASLRALVAEIIKSARVLTDAKRVGENSTNPGTLFKVDCDKMNRFYLVGKGQLRWFDNDYASNNVDTQVRSLTQYASNQPYLSASTYYDQSIEALFGHMFEQFSPSMASGGSSLNDIYRLLVNGESFDVKHDCIDVISADSKGHEFNMYGKDSPSSDCQDVRDMMFFVPDYRMTTFTHPSVAKWSRDPNAAQKFLYYDSIHGHAPTVGLYVIKLDPITQINKVENEAAYDVTLNWSSNLLKFLPGETGKYTLYRVTVDAGGTETYTTLTEITTSDASELTYVDRVPQQSGSQVVTYAVRGQDQDGFLSLQMSNKESALIPGTDTSEQLQLELGADYYSRFDPDAVKNNYSNLIKLGNSQVTKIQSSYLTTDGTEQFTFTRKYVDANGQPVVQTFATAHVATLGANSGTLVITMQNQEFFKYGYQGNGNSASANNPNGNTITKSFSFDAMGVNFGQVQFFDNFSASVADNDHPSEYVYQVRFDYNDPENNNEPCYALSNEMPVYVQKTDMSMANALTLEQVNGDTGRGLPAGSVDFDIQVRYSSKKDILRYDAYRWNEGESRYIIEPSSTATNEQDVAPNGIAGNQGDYYTIAMNTDNYLYTGETTVSIGGVANARFKDYYADANAGNYVYVPVVERFAPREDRTDYNTYGAPLRPAVTANVKLDVPEVNGQGQPNPVMSEENWISGGKQYAYYTVLLDITSRGEGNEVLVPSDYQLYKVRVWRLVDDPDDVLGERLSNRLGRAVADYLVEELTYPDIQATTTGTLLGNSPTPFPNPRTGEVAATFGALDVKANQIDIPLKFIVRAYYTLTSNLTQPASGAPRREAVQVADDAKFYVVEREIDVLLDGTSQDPIVTAISGIVADRQVAGVTYYNLLGVPSARPTKGINVKVTRYTDGTFSTTKIVY